MISDYERYKQAEKMAQEEFKKFDLTEMHSLESAYQNRVSVIYTKLKENTNA